ncbi:hypothetical protein [Ornithinimicrobium tianjinense]|uniref:Uncharacterized protein n=1 Tax=Ornithinimicrobium tianjinense TaxID=1195761 RepID=A0A917BDJ9_9MICO|nr:hypothetical protein [Ornithinimicrobium tianjinense]GGF38500.1 hypothetical protein GCM10011366_02600 [Ornithinimicrobium tianjinense]
MDDVELEDPDVDDEPEDDEPDDEEEAVVELEEVSFAAEEVVAGTVLAEVPEPRESVR